MYELVLKMHAVQRRLIKKSETVITKQEQLHDLERINRELKKQLIRRPGPDVGERLNQSRDAVKAKSRQIKACLHLKLTFVKHLWIQPEICNKTIVMFFTTPELCSYTTL